MTSFSSVSGDDLGRLFHNFPEVSGRCGGTAIAATAHGNVTNSESKSTRNLAVLKWGAVQVRFKSDAFRAADVLHAIQTAEQAYPRLMHEIASDVFVGLTKLGDHSVGVIVQRDQLVHVETGDDPLPKIFKRLAGHIKRHATKLR